ncbi:MAG TPA: alcohol dehydrogenase catalytic domain-containing protein [Polyangia bacterium]
MLVRHYRLDGGPLAAPAPIRPPGASEVVVKVAGIALGVEPPAEIAGEVVAAGESAGEWLGRRVVVPRCLPCGDCDRCRRARAASCPNRAARDGLADFEIVPARYLCSVEPPLWPSALEPAIELWQLAALADAASAPYGALLRSGLGPGELVVILGGGIRGAFAIALARSLGAHAAVIESDPARGERARALGALCVIESERSPDEIHDQLASFSAPLGLADHGYKILETTGAFESRNRALALLPDGGTAAFLEPSGGIAASLDGNPSVAQPSSGVDWAHLVAREAQLLGAGPCHPELYPELCAKLVRGELPLSLLTSAVAPEEAARAREAHLAGRLLPLPIVRPPPAAE